MHARRRQRQRRDPRRRSSGLDALDQRGVDQALLDLDGTDNKARLGANAILGVSLAVAKAAADELEHPAVPLRRRHQRPRAAGADDERAQRRRPRRQQRRLPGVHDHAGRRGQLLRGAALGRRDLPRAQGRSCTTGACPPPSATRAASPPTWPPTRSRVELLVEAIEKAGFTPGDDIAIALDPATTEFFEDGAYVLAGEGRTLTSGRDGRLLGRPVRPLPDRVDRGRHGRGGLGRLGRPHRRASATACSWWATTCSSPTPSASPGASRPASPTRSWSRSTRSARSPRRSRPSSLANRAGYTAVMSHRSGETEDTTIADLAVATNCGQIKTGAPGPQRPGGQVQPAAAHRGGARRGRRVPRCRPRSAEGATGPDGAPGEDPSPPPRPSAGLVVTVMLVRSCSSRSSPPGPGCSSAATPPRSRPSSTEVQRRARPRSSASRRRSRPTEEIERRAKEELGWCTRARRPSTCCRRPPTRSGCPRAGRSPASSGSSAPLTERPR